MLKPSSSKMNPSPLMPPLPSPDLKTLVDESVSRATALQQCERDIEEGMASFVRMGQSLRRIRDESLYPDEYSSFSDYCERRWEWSRQQAYRLMDAAQSFVEIEVAQPKALPSTERQLRPMSRVDAEDKPAVWEAATQAAEAEGLSQPQHQHVEAAVEQHKGEAQSSNVVQLKPKPPKPLANEDVLGTSLEVAQARIKHLIDAIASMLAEYEGTGELSETTVERLTNEIAGLPAA